MNRRCDNCRWCIMKDYGYSNWTVEGTEQDCLVKLHPRFPLDHFYGETAENAYAEECARYNPGEPIRIDVDREYTLDEISNYKEVQDKFITILALGAKETLASQWTTCGDKEVEAYLRRLLEKDNERSI